MSELHGGEGAEPQSPGYEIPAAPSAEKEEIGEPVEPAEGPEAESGPDAPSDDDEAEPVEPGDPEGSSDLEEAERQEAPDDEPEEPDEFAAEALDEAARDETPDAPEEPQDFVDEDHIEDPEEVEPQAAAEPGEIIESQDAAVADGHDTDLHSEADGNTESAEPAGQADSSEAAPSANDEAAPGDEPDRLAVATHRDINLDELGIPVVWRTDNLPLHRNDNREPDIVFGGGFKPLDPSRVDLVEYVQESNPSALVSTSYRDDIGEEFGGKFTYLINAPGGIDVNASMGDHPLSYEQEVAFPGGIRTEYISGARPYNYATAELGDFIPNPNYRPEDDRVT
ncbi:hypothetical protein ACIRBY_17180 [Streptomyces sp. NPDC096136]|uniref:scabin-related ADP-ribosyltransferase n=1 Tax=Streptomyces sp. NPDC096136 TaxID=3366076 RepID=UPI00380E7E72